MTPLIWKMIDWNKLNDGIYTVKLTPVLTPEYKKGKFNIVLYLNLFQNKTGSQLKSYCV